MNFQGSPDRAASGKPRIDEQPSTAASVSDSSARRTPRTKARAQTRAGPKPEPVSAADFDAVCSGTSVDAQPGGWTHALQVLDSVLGIAVDHQARLLGPATLLDPWRGMHLDTADVERLLAQHGPQPLLPDLSVAHLLADAMRAVPRIQALTQSCTLDAHDLAVLLIALAPDIDLRYVRLYSYLQDDIARRRPSLDLLANLLTRNPGERIALRDRLGPAAPLGRLRLLESIDEPHSSALAKGWQVDAIWRAWLLEESSPPLDELAPNAILNTPFDAPALAALPQSPATRHLLEQACAAAQRHRTPLRIQLLGRHGCGKFDTARSVARRMGLRVLTFDLRSIADAVELVERIQRTARAAWLFGALMVAHGVHHLEQRDPQLLRVLVGALADTPCHFALACTDSLPTLHTSPLPLLRVALAFPDAQQRARLWRDALDASGVQIDPASCEAIADRFALSATQIGQAAAEASVLALTRNDDDTIGYAELSCAARLQCGTELARMAQRIAPRAGLGVLVTLPEVRAQLCELCARMSTRELVSRDWAGDSVHARSRGVTALFVGPSGTGKTLSAEAIACELGLDLFRIDLAGIVSKYIGETEKNLDRVFAAAEHSNAVLFFDEADALFGKRSEVKDAHDRYANIEVAYLLQKMEQFDGLAVLATNLKQNLDESFARRLTFTINFPFPEENERRLLWESLWPPRAPRADDVDLVWFAREFRLSGGNIRNAVVAAAHLAASDGTPIGRAHLMHATRREFQKLGKTLKLMPSGEIAT